MAHSSSRSRIGNPFRTVGILLVVLALAVVTQWDRIGELEQQSEAPVASLAPQSAPSAETPLTGDFTVFADHTWVSGCGRVVKLLPDDTEPPCHQRFLVVDTRGKSLLIVNNIDDYPRLADVAVGKKVAFRGEYIDNDRGGLVHWTHPDKSGKRAGGWVRLVD